MSLTQRPGSILWRTSHELFDCATSLSEPNLLVCDSASHHLDSSLKWDAPEEILRIGNIATDKLGFILKKDSFAQPWATAKLNLKNFKSLKFEIRSAIDVAGAYIALESAAVVTHFSRWRYHPNEINGYWVDECISTIPPPPFAARTYELIHILLSGRATNLERHYILGISELICVAEKLQYSLSGYNILGSGTTFGKACHLMPVIYIMTSNSIWNPTTIKELQFKFHDLPRHC